MDNFSECITRHTPIATGDHVLVALSGGPDSMALLHVLKADAQTRKYTLEALHFDHGLREESAREATWVRDYCLAQGIPCAIQNLAVKDYAAQFGTGIEGAGHALRKKALAKHREATGATWIALAHHADDQAETLLLHLIRGSGLLGLTAMHAQNGPFVRPFLSVRKQDLLAYCHQQHIPYIVDASNSDLRFRRNAIRHRLMPFLEEMNPQVVESLCRTAEILQLDEETLNHLTNARFNALAKVQAHCVTFPRKALQEELAGVQDRLWQKAVTTLAVEKVLSFKHYEALRTMLHTQAYAKEFNLGDGLYARFEKERCIIERQHDLKRLPALSRWTMANHFQQSPLYRLCITRGVPFTPDHGRWHLWLPAPRPCIVRNRQPGDAIRIKGLGRKTVKKLFQEHQLSPYQRRWWPILCDETGEEILWIPGLALAESIQTDVKSEKMGIYIKMCLL